MVPHLDLEALNQHGGSQFSPQSGVLSPTNAAYSERCCRRIPRKLPISKTADHALMEGRPRTGPGLRQSAIRATAARPMSRNIGDVVELGARATAVRRRAWTAS